MYTTRESLDILLDMYEDGAPDIVCFFETVEAMAKAVAIRGSRAIGDVIAPMMIHERRREDTQIIKGAIYSMLSRMTIADQDEDEVTPEYVLDHMTILQRVVTDVANNGKSLADAIRAVFG